MRIRKEHAPHGTGDIDAARALVEEAEDAELFLYPGDQHYFADSTLPSYDARAAALPKQRVFDFLGARQWRGRMASGRSLDFRGERLDDADLSGARLHSPNLEGTRITYGWLHNADISGYIGGLCVNGVEVAPLVEAELDRRFPERVKLRTTDPQGLVEAWALIEEVWRTTVARARTLPEALLFERVDGEWSFVETLRHLVFATDAWLFRMIRGRSRPYHPWGLAGSFLTDPTSLGLDYDASPPPDEVLAVRCERMDAVKETIAALTSEELARVCVPTDVPGHPAEAHSVLECLHVILDEGVGAQPLRKP